MGVRDRPGGQRDRIAVVVEISPAIGAAGRHPRHAETALIDAPICVARVAGSATPVAYSRIVTGALLHSCPSVTQQGDG